MLRNIQPKQGQQVDQYTGALTVIAETHRMTHEGFVFHADRKVTGLADAGTDDMLIAVPAATFPHMHRIRINTGKGDIDITLYEGTTTSADGTAVTSFVTNRNSANTPDVVITHTPTVTGVGTAIHSAWIPPTATGVGQSAEGVRGAEQGEEWLLKPSTKYLLRVTNNSGSTIDLWVELLWYEIGY